MSMDNLLKNVAKVVSADYKHEKNRVEFSSKDLFVIVDLEKVSIISARGCLIEISYILNHLESAIANES